MLCYAFILLINQFLQKMIYKINNYVLKHRAKGNMQDNNNYHTNYTEYTYSSYNIDDADFVYIYKKIKPKFKICFQQSCINYVRENKVYEFHTMQKNNNSKLKVYQKDSCEVNTIDDFIVATYNKRKIPYYLFSSDNNYDSTYNISKMIFRIHNNIYLNFETSTYPDDNSHFNKIYINYNHEDKIEQTLMTNLIEDTKSLIKEAHQISVPIF